MDSVIQVNKMEQQKAPKPKVNAMKVIKRLRSIEPKSRSRFKVTFLDNEENNLELTNLENAVIEVSGFVDLWKRQENCENIDFDLVIIDAEDNGGRNDLNKLRGITFTVVVSGLNSLNQIVDNVRFSQCEVNYASYDNLDLRAKNDPRFIYISLIAKQAEAAVV